MDEITKIIQAHYDENVLGEWELLLYDRYAISQSPDK